MYDIYFNSSLSTELGLNDRGDTPVNFGHLCAAKGL